MKIVVTGIYRTGTTWLFNAVRLMLRESGYDVRPFFYSTEHEYREAQHSIVKVHAWYPHLKDEADLILTTYRPLNEISLSMEYLKGRTESQFENACRNDLLMDFCDDHLKWKEHAAYTMDYPTMTRNPEQIIYELNLVLVKRFGPKVYLSEEQQKNVVVKLSELKAPTEGFDPETLMTSTHYKFH